MFLHRAPAPGLRLVYHNRRSHVHTQCRLQLRLRNLYARFSLLALLVRVLLHLLALQ